MDVKTYDSHLIPYLRNRRIAILFLASQGISHPDLWKIWRNELPGGEQKILFYGIMPNDIDGWIRLPVEIPQKWCGEDLALAYQQGLRYILKRDRRKRLTKIFLVSGQDIPIRNSAYVFFMRSEPMMGPSEFCSVRVPPVKLSDHQKENKIAPFLKKSAQWIALLRPDAEKIAATDFSTLFHDFHQDFTRWSPLETHISKLEALQGLMKFIKNIETEVNEKKDESKREVFKNTYEILFQALQREYEREKKEPIVLKKGIKGVVEPVLCPDEYYPVTTWAFLHPKEELNHQCTTGLSKINNFIYQMPSPITWNSWDSKITSSLQEYEPTDLLHEIKHACDNDRVFFRKVSSALPSKWKGKYPWQYCADYQHPINRKTL